jgi:hypothetical protein
MLFTLIDTEDCVQRYVRDGKAICVTTRVTIIDPAEIWFADLEAAVLAVARQNDEGEWEIDDDPLFGSFWGKASLQELVSEVAQWCNDQGVSVTDTVIRAYELAS